MSDFAQAGLICSLQRLNDAHLSRIEAELVELAREQRVALVLPCHAADLEKAAFNHLVHELSGARFLAEIVLSLNGLSRREFEERHGERFSLGSPCTVTTLLFHENGGKGGNISAAITHLAATERCEIVVTEDCDVASFQRADLARLCYAVAHPQLRYRFAKAYYSRVTDRLYGRVSRLFLAPLLQAILRSVGHQPLIDFLLSFRYPLAGEVAMSLEFARTLPRMNGWGFEIGQLCEVFRRIDPRECCQVDGGAGYDHKHQPATPALAQMAGEIAAELFRQLTLEGIVDSAKLRVAIASAYRREAALAVQRSASLALINGLPFDNEMESALVEVFAGQLVNSP